MNNTSKVAGLSLIMETDDEVARAAAFLAALGLEVTGEDGFVEVSGPSIRLSIMRGAMIEVPRFGGLLLQLAVADVDATAKIAGDNGGEVMLGPLTTDWGGYSAYVRGPAGLTVELMTATAG